MNSIIETAKNIIANYSHREDCKDMVANAVRILKDKGVAIFEEVATGRLHEVVRTLKASIEVRTLVPVFDGDYNCGHLVRKIRQDNYGEYYLVGWKEKSFTKVN